MNEYLIATKMGTIHDTYIEYEITCTWKSKYNLHVYMIQTYADIIFQNLIVFVIAAPGCVISSVH